MSLPREAAMLAQQGGGQTKRSPACRLLLAEAEAGKSARWFWTDCVLVFPHSLSADPRLDTRKLAEGKVGSEERCTFSPHLSSS